MTDNPTPATKVAPSEAPSPPEPDFKARLASAVAGCSTANRAMLKFPTDKWGFTSNLKKEGVNAISKLTDSEEKYELLILTFQGLITHAKHKKAQIDSRKTVTAEPIKLHNQ